MGWMSLKCAFPLWTLNCIVHFEYTWKGSTNPACLMFIQTASLRSRVYMDISNSNDLYHSACYSCEHVLDAMKRHPLGFASSECVLKQALHGSSWLMFPLLPDWFFAYTAWNSYSLKPAWTVLSMQMGPKNGCLNICRQVKRKRGWKL